jgi:hypothetical protein
MAPPTGGAVAAFRGHWGAPHGQGHRVGIDVAGRLHRVGQGRPFFGSLGVEDVLLGDPTVCIQGDRVTHLVFPVQARSSTSV